MCVEPCTYIDARTKRYKVIDTLEILFLHLKKKKNM